MLSFKKLSLRFRIFLSMLVVIIISFILTGIVSIYHFRKENQNYHQERLVRKEYSLDASLRYFLQTRSPQTEEDLIHIFDDKICELADIHRLDINIYGISGKLLISSNPELVNEGIVPEELPRNTIDRILQGEVHITSRSKAGNVLYMSMVDLFEDFDGNPIGILHIPYFEEGDTSHLQDVNAFLVTLIEIYLLIFLVAATLAYFLSNYITGRLTSIAKKLREIRLNKKNEPLPYHSKDEIGQLVVEYNKMVKQLEENALALARSERESAWKEMARQVAHEIKNPLTPMRLNVQYFEKSASKMNEAEIHEFSQSLIDQIDTLSRIAEAFSRFANMPELKREPVVLNTVIESCARLHPEVGISKKIPQNDILIKGDREQLIRVFNNLIQNAIQAIPEDREPIIELGLRTKNGIVQAWVKDNGCGIPEDKIEKIFEPSFTTKSSGMGLGLAMVRNIVKGLEAEVCVKSKVNQGSMFKIKFKEMT